MSNSSNDFDVRLSDVKAFLAVRAHGSVTGAARWLGSTPSHISKSIDRLERQLGAKLLNRSGRGIKLTRAATQLFPLLMSAAESLGRARQEAASPRDITVAAPSYLLHAYLPALALVVQDLRLRALQLSPPGILAGMGAGQFEVALSTGTARTPPTWTTEVVGEMHAGLFARPDLAKRLARATPEELRRVPFIVPVTFRNDQWEAIDEGCPIPVTDRVAGHEAPSIGLALEIATAVPQLAFGPRLAARHHVKDGRLVEVPVKNWNVTMSLWLAVDANLTSARDFKHMKAAAHSLLDWPPNSSKTAS
jgi:DNA-binding transcriptional LysR family regulator